MTEEEYEKSRSLPEFLNWVDCFFNNPTLERETEIRERNNDLVKKMVTEARPLRNFIRGCGSLFSTDTKVKMHSGSQSYDATITQEGVDHKYEITVTEDAKDAFTRQHLEQHGRAPGRTHSIDRSSDLTRWRKNGKPEMMGQPMPLQVLIDQEIEAIQLRISKKLSNGNYNGDEILIVQSDDTCFYGVSDQCIKSRVLDAFKNHPRRELFSEVHLVLHGMRVINLIW